MLASSVLKAYQQTLHSISLGTTPVLFPTAIEWLLVISRSEIKGENFSAFFNAFNFALVVAFAVAPESNYTRDSALHLFDNFRTSISMNLVKFLGVFPRLT